MKTFDIVYFQLLLLQLEEYDLKRYLKAVANTRGLPPKSPIRKPLVWTAKIKSVYALSLLLFLATLFVVNSSGINPLVRLAILVLMAVVHFFFHFIFITAAAVLLSPFDYMIKELTIYRAKMKIRELKKLKIIGVAGSYGKTGMKEFISSVLEQKYNVVKTGGSVNTPYAIAELILKKLTNDTEIFVLEMGEYYRGDIENICKIARPDISVVTGINEAHLERLKTIDNTVSTIFEIVENMNPKGLVVLNAKDKTVKSNYKRFVKNQEVYLYQNRNRGDFDEKIPGYVINISKNRVFFPLLGSYNLDKIDGAVFIGKKLGLNDNELVNGIKNIRPVPHRLQPIVNPQSKTLIIDDSYNGNPDGVEEAIKTLKLFGKRTKIYVTPGLVEMGEKSPEIHYNIGRSLADTADLVVLIKNSVTPDIERGLLDNKFNPKQIVWFESADEAYRNIKNLAKPSSVVLLQNDWPDNYI
jgi:UDP-N-acetylmuramoyl-tripeptide--D-alanyl-D-alanine ligase